MRVYLTALVLLPLLACIGFGGLAITSSLDRASRASRIEMLTLASGRLAAVQTAAQAELLPNLAAAVQRLPQLQELVRTNAEAIQKAGVTPGQARHQRELTDATIREIARDPILHESASGIRAVIRTARKQIDSVLGLFTGYFKIERLSVRLTERVRALNLQAAELGTSPNLVRALSDVRLVSQAVLAAPAEQALLGAVQLPRFIGKSAFATRREWYRAWADSDSASDSILRNASPALVAKWRQVIRMPAVREYEAAIDRLASNLGNASMAQMLELYRLHNIRSTGIDSVQDAALSTARFAAAQQRGDARRDATLVAVLVGMSILVSIVIATLVLRWITRPLRVLAAQAENVSRGALVEVEVGGPREVRTVAKVFATAVDNLRRVEAQACAVAAGNLESAILYEPLPGPLGEIMHTSVATMVHAIHDRDRAQRDLAHQATHDALTGLPNRAQAMVSIENALQRTRRGGSLTALMFVDLDFFKTVNDNHGHAAGDEVLRVCALRMITEAQPHGAVFRLGGDEFVVLLEVSTSEFDLVGVGERIVAAISRPIEVHSGGTALIGASVGITVDSGFCPDAERLLGEADAAAYSAKQAGRNCVDMFDDDLRDTITRRAAMERALDRALENDEFVLYYQAVVELSTGRPTGFEALIRWQHPDFGLSHPDMFIPTAEKSTVINRIGQWTLRRALGQLAEWDASNSVPSTTSMAVNISGRHLASAELVDEVREALESTGIAAGRLVVEITETVLVEDNKVIGNMEALRDLGVIIAIDDFGTGYTSIGQLSKLPIDLLKIDRSFVASSDPGHRQLVRLLVEAAHTFGMTVVAEGIERADQADALNNVRADLGQGFYFSRPQPPAAAGTLAVLPTLPEPAAKALPA